MRYLKPAAWFAVTAVWVLFALSVTGVVPGWMFWSVWSAASLSVAGISVWLYRQRA